MFKNKYIRKFLSGFLLAVFVLGITPKRFLHNLFATHIDNIEQKTGSKPLQFSSAGFNCDCDNLVAESVFTGESDVFQINLPVSYLYYKTQSFTLTSLPGIYSLLRGPPATV